MQERAQLPARLADCHAASRLLTAAKDSPACCAKALAVVQAGTAGASGDKKAASAALLAWQDAMDKGALTAPTMATILTALFGNQGAEAGEATGTSSANASVSPHSPVWDPSWGSPIAVLRYLLQHFAEGMQEEHHEPGNIRDYYGLSQGITIPAPLQPVTPLATVILLHPGFKAAVVAVLSRPDVASSAEAADVLQVVATCLAAQKVTSAPVKDFFDDQVAGAVLGALRKVAGRYQQVRSSSMPSGWAVVQEEACLTRLTVFPCDC